MDDHQNKDIQLASDLLMTKNKTMDNDLAKLKQSAQVLLNQYLKHAHIYCLKPQIQRFPKPKYTYPQKGLIVRNTGSIIRISTNLGFLSGLTSYQNLIEIIESSVRGLKANKTSEIAIRGTQQLQNILIDFCSKKKYDIKIVNFPEEKLSQAIQNRKP